MLRQYVSETNEDNTKTKNRISALKQELESLDHTSTQYKPFLQSPSVLISSRSQDSPNKAAGRMIRSVSGQEDEVELTSAQEFQLKAALEDTLKEKSEIVTRLKEGLDSLTIDIQDKNLKKEELENLYKIKTQEILKTENVLKQEIQSLAENLDTGMVYRRRENYGFKQEMEKIKIKLRKQKKAIEKLQKEKETLEKTIESIKKEAEDANTLKISKFRGSIAPLEDAAKTVDLQKAKLLDKVSEGEQNYEKSVNQLELLKEDLIGKFNQIQELTEKRDTLKKSFNDFKLNYSEELQYFFDGLKHEKELEKMEEEKENLTKQMKDNETKRTELMKDLGEQTKIIKILETKIGETQKLIESTLQDKHELDKIQKYLSTKAGGVDQDIFTIIQTIAENAGFNVGNEIFVRQLKLVEKEELKLMMDHTKGQEIIKESIHKLEEEINDISGRIKEIRKKREEVTGGPKIKKEEIRKLKQEDRSEENKLTKNYKSKSAHLKLLRDKFDKNKLQHKCKIETIEKWRIQMKAKQMGIEDNLVNDAKFLQLSLDQEISEEILKRILFQIDDTEEQKTFSEMWTLFCRKLQERETKIQKYQSEKHNYMSYIESSISEKAILEEKIRDLEGLSAEIKNKYMECTVNEKAIEQIIEEKKAQLEYALMRQGEDQFKEYMKKHSNIFQDVKKTYGIKIMEKMKVDHRKEFNEITALQQRERKRNIQIIHNEINYLTKALDKANIILNQKLLADITQTSEEVKRNKENCSVYQNQLAAIISAENEISAQIEVLLERKKEELFNSVQSLYRKRNFESSSERFQEVKDVLENKENVFEKLEGDLDQLEKTSYERTTNYAVQKKQLSLQLEETKKQLQELQKVVKPQLMSLQQEIRDYDYQIVTDRKKHQILNQKLSSSVNNFNLAKQVFSQKFSSELESPTKIDYEYTADYEKMKLEMREEEKKKKIEVRPSVDIMALDTKEEQAVPTSQKLQLLESVKKEEEQLEPEPKYGKISINMQDFIKSSDAEKKAESKIEESKTFSYSHFNHSKSLYRINLEECSLKEIQLFDAMKPLLEGIQIYKKFTKRDLLNQKGFDPLNSDKIPPESCGFGMRLMILNPSLSQIEFRNLDRKKRVECTLKVKDIKRPIIPTSTAEIIKIQRAAKMLPSQQKEDSKFVKEKEPIPSMGAPMTSSLSLGQLPKNVKNEELKFSASKIFENRDNMEYIQQCCNVKNYPFSLITTEDRLDYIAESYNSYRFITNALSEIAKNQTSVKSVGKKIQPLKGDDDEDDSQYI